MKILPKITDMKCSRLAQLKENYTLVTFNNSNNVALSFVETDKSNFDILSDLLEHKAYATALLYLNENYILSDKFSDLLENSNIEDYYSDCEALLSKNIKIVEEAGAPLTEINGYKIFESQNGILRGNGNKKLMESFNEIDLEDITLDYLKNRDTDPFIKGMIQCPECGSILDKEEVKFDDEEEYDTEVYDGFDKYHTETKTKTVEKAICPNCGHGDELDNFYGATVDDLFGAPNAEELVPGINTLEENQSLQEDGEGTQTTDIAPKIDQELGINIPNTTSKKKYYDILLDMNENELPIINKGFMKNSKGQYQRGNYILVKEGDKYLAVHKDKLQEEKITFTNKDLDKYLKLVNSTVASVIQDTDKAITFEVSNKGTLMNKNTVMFYSIPILHDNGADLIGLSDEIKTRLNSYIDDYRIKGITVTPTREKELSIDIGLFSGEKPIEI